MIRRHYINKYAGTRCTRKKQRQHNGLIVLIVKLIVVYNTTLKRLYAECERDGHVPVLSDLPLTPARWRCCAVSRVK